MSLRFFPLTLIQDGRWRYEACKKNQLKACLLASHRKITMHKLTSFDCTSLTQLVDHPYIPRGHTLPLPPLPHSSHGMDDDAVRYVRAQKQKFLSIRSAVRILHTLTMRITPTSRGDSGHCPSLHLLSLSSGVGWYGTLPRAHSASWRLVSLSYRHSAE